MERIVYAKRKLKHLQRQVDTLTKRLTTCPLDEFHAVQAALFHVQRQMKALQGHCRAGKCAYPGKCAKQCATALQTQSKGIEVQTGTCSNPQWEETDVQPTLKGTQRAAFCRYYYRSLAPRSPLCTPC